MKKTVSFSKCLLTTALIGSMITITPAQANNPAPRIKADAPNRYTVKKGDTLWNLSGRYLNKPWRWKDIWATNKQIKNPNLIYPGDVLIMCVIKGKTLVGVDTGEGCTGVEKQASESYKPQAVSVRPASSSIPAIPLSNIRYFLDRVMIVNPEDFAGTPYVLASKSRNLITGQGDKIYVKGVPLKIGQTYGIYREGQPYVDPRTKKVIGLETTEVAKGIVTDVASNGVSSIKLTKSYGKEVLEGDRAFVEMGDNFLPPVFNPQPAKVNRPGSVIRVNDSIGMTGVTGVLAINLGKQNGTKIGDVFTVYQKGPLVRDVYDNDFPVRLPSEPSGNIMVFRTFDKISYAYVLDSELPMRTGDQVLPPSY